MPSARLSLARDNAAPTCDWFAAAQLSLRRVKVARTSRTECE
jgi:hypothetical protein